MINIISLTLDDAGKIKDWVEIRDTETTPLLTSGRGVGEDSLPNWAKIKFALLRAAAAGETVVDIPNVGYWDKQMLSCVYIYPPEEIQPNQTCTVWRIK